MFPGGGGLRAGGGHACCRPLWDRDGGVVGRGMHVCVYVHIQVPFMCMYLFCMTWAWGCGVREGRMAGHRATPEICPFACKAQTYQSLNMFSSNLESSGR